MIAVKDYDTFKSYSGLACCCFEIKIFEKNKKSNEVKFTIT